MSEKKPSTRGTPKPFRYRGSWRSQVTLKNGSRPHSDFDTFDEAKEWIEETLANNDTDKPALLGGPTAATLCDMLDHYLRNHCLAKAGVAQEIDRANHYFAAAGRTKLALVVNEKGQKSITTAGEARTLKIEKKALKDSSSAVRVGGNEAGKTPSSFDAHNKARVASHPQTYAMFARLAIKTASSISAADMRSLHTAMTAEAYSESTIQKEVALLKAMFNIARTEWEWKSFENPCIGIKLKAATPRFVVVTKAQRERLRDALAACDNPEFWPFVELTLATTQRMHSMRGLEWERVDLENRVMQVWAKGRWVVVPLSKRAVTLLEGLPGDRTGRAFTLTQNAIDCAWDGVRIKAGLPKLHFHDLRHVGATDLAREGMSVHQLMKVLAHTTPDMSMVYVNLASTDIHYAMDKIEASLPQAPLPPAGQDRALMMNVKKGKRLLQVKIIDPVGMKSTPAEKPALLEEELPSNVLKFKTRAPAKSPSVSEPQGSSAARAP